MTRLIELRKQKSPIRELTSSHFFIEGRAELTDVAKALDIILESEDSATLSGFVMEQLDRLPEINDVFSYKEFRFIVKHVDNQRVEEVEIIKQVDQK